MPEANLLEPAQAKDPLAFVEYFLTQPGLIALEMIALLVVCLAHNRLFFHDDSFITLRYARHLLAGQGPVWNITGPRVEGFTSVLDLLLISAVGAFHVALPTAARIVAFSSHLALLVFVFRYLVRRTGALGAALGVLIMAASWMFLIWDLGGLDAVLYASLSAIGILTGVEYLNPDKGASARAFKVSAVCLAFAALARPEGIAMLGWLFFLAMVFGSEPLAERRRTLAVAFVLAMLVLLPSEIFRFAYFHELVPNTFYAKMGGINTVVLVRLGLRYLLVFLYTAPYLGILAPAAALLAWRRRAVGRVDAALWSFVAVDVFLVATCGGDHMFAFRFLLPIVPLLTILLVRSLHGSGVLTNLRMAAASALVLSVALWLQILYPILNPCYPDPAALVGSAVGQYIAQSFPADSRIALNTAGSTPYFADNHEYIDMLGLNDSVIARRTNIPVEGPWTHLIGHLKGDGAYVLSRRPDFIILGPAEGTTPELSHIVHFFGDYEIGNSPDFRRDYEVCYAPIPVAAGVFTYYQRREAQRPCPSLYGRGY